MNYFPRTPSFKTIAATSVSSLGSVRQKRLSDILWGQPLFKAPALRIPRLQLEPIPFTAARITQRNSQS